MYPKVYRLLLDHLSELLRAAAPPWPVEQITSPFRLGVSRVLHLELGHTTGVRVCSSFRDNSLHVEVGKLRLTTRVDREHLPVEDSSLR